MSACWVSQPVFCQGLNAIVITLMVMVLKKTWRNNISFKKEADKRLCYYKWKTWYKLLSRSGLKEIFVRVSIIHHQTKTSFSMFWIAWTPFELLWTFVTYLLCTRKMLNWTWYWYCLWSFHTLQFKHNGEFDSVVVYIILSGFSAGFSLSFLWGGKFFN